MKYIDSLWNIFARTCSFFFLLLFNFFHRVLHRVASVHSCPGDLFTNEIAIYVFEAARRVSYAILNCDTHMSITIGIVCTKDCSVNIENYTQALPLETKYVLKCSIISKEAPQTVKAGS